MKKDFNKMTTNDMPMDNSFTPNVHQVSPHKKSQHPKIKAIGKNTGKSANKVQYVGSSFGPPVMDIVLKAQKDLSDLEQMNDENIKAYRFKSKRNKVIIILLSIMLTIAIASIATYIVIARLQANCRLYVHGTDATFIVDGEELSAFRAPSNLKDGVILEFELELKLKDAGKYDIKFNALCYQKDVLMKNTLIYNKSDLFYDGGIIEESDTFCYSKQPISGKQTIRLCGGIIIDNGYKSLNVDNFKMEFHVYCEKV